MRAITWIKERGAEFAEADLASGLRAVGVAVSGDPVPYRLEYELDCGADLVTRRLSVRTWGAGWGRHLELTRDPGAGWSVDAGSDGDTDVPGLPPPGGDPASFATAQDCDLGECPLTNTMPVLRHGLLAGGGPVDLVMAWVSVPGLAVTPSRQRYRHLRRGAAAGLGLELAAGPAGPLSVIGFQSGDFSAEVAFDAEGLVVDYPGIARLA